MKRAFTLVEIMIVVALIAVLITLAVPGLFRSRLITQEATAIANLKILTNACSYYLSNTGSFPATLTALSETNPPYIDTTLASGQKQKYQFEYLLVDADHFTIQASPLSTGLLKGRYFYVDEGGIIHVRQDGPAGPNDAIVG